MLLMQMFGNMMRYPMANIDMKPEWSTPKIMTDTLDYTPKHRALRIVDIDGKAYYFTCSEAYLRSICRDIMKMIGE